MVIFFSELFLPQSENESPVHFATETSAAEAGSAAFAGGRSSQLGKSVYGNDCLTSRNATDLGKLCFPHVLDEVLFLHVRRRGEELLIHK